MAFASAIRKAYRRYRARFGWDRLWKNPSYAPAWFIDGPRHPTREAVADGWFPKGSSILEVGCGRGQEAAWLAAEGFRVHAVDISPHAIRHARNTYGSAPALSFQVLDVTVPTHLPPFDIIVDSGCLHCIPPELLPDCAANIRNWSQPGTRLLVMMHCASATPADRVRQVETLFTPAFAVLSVGDSYDPARPNHTRPRVVFRLLRADVA